MPKIIKPPNMYMVLMDNIDYLCDMYGVSQEEQRVTMRISSATYCRRKLNPETFKVGELERLAKRLSVTVPLLFTERKWSI